MKTIRRLSNWFGLHPMAGDIIWAVFLLQPALGNIAAYVGNGFLTAIPNTGPGSALALLWGASYALPFIWRRTRPALACTLLTIPHLVQLVIMPGPLFTNLYVPLMMFAIAAYGSERARRLWLILGLAAAAVGSVDWVAFSERLRPEGIEETEASAESAVLSMTAFFIMSAASVAVSWLLGAFTRERLVTVRTLKDRADAIAAERDRFAQLAAEQERSRIAREMHDVVAHSLSVIVVQTDGAAYALEQPGDTDKKLELATAALHRIASTSREALRETRALVGVLREGEAPELAPQPGLDEIDELVETTRTSGLGIDYAVDGSPEDHPPLGTARETAAYRIVQESLTNVIKHAGAGARAQVHLSHSPEGLMVSVRDNGHNTDEDDGHGHGLIGMRERVAPFRGTLTARPRLDGGFEVLASIPAPTEQVPVPSGSHPAAPPLLTRITDLTRRNA